MTYSPSTSLLPSRHVLISGRPILTGSWEKQSQIVARPQAERYSAVIVYQVRDDECRHTNERYEQGWHRKSATPNQKKEEPTTTNKTKHTEQETQEHNSTKKSQV